MRRRMASTVGQRPSPPSRGPSTAEARLSIRDLEIALEQARAERDAEFGIVEEELGRLNGIYARLREDFHVVREERDRALDAVREERERRARETMELTERLGRGGALDAASLRDQFVAE